MRGVNKVILVGNLGRDPESRSTNSGSCVANFSLATTESVKKNGEYTDHTEWHNLVVFGKQAEAATNYLKKGSCIYVEGRINTRKWQDKEGRDRYTTEIMVSELKFLDQKRGDAPPSSGHEPDPDEPF